MTWPAPLTGGSAPKPLWDTSSLSGSGGLQIGARFDGAYAPPEADPISAVVDRACRRGVRDGRPALVAAPGERYGIDTIA
ncbi:hypothetical protein [Streptomyces gardneri]|uniref:hypothetical protein n=1 Tax=Streptomyces gardneri TaxID=66892 RepID=UPI0035DC0E3D